MKTSGSLLFILSIVVVSCVQESPNGRTISHNQFSLTVPYHMTETDGLNIGSTLEYQNLNDELYLTIHEEPKTNFNNIPKIGEASVFSNDINGYALYHLTYYETVLDGFRATSVKQETINKLPAVTVFANNTVMGVEMHYLMGFFEGETKYYRLETFTLGSLRSQNDNDMLMIINSFKEQNR